MKIELRNFFQNQDFIEKFINSNSYLSEEVEAILSSGKCESLLIDNRIWLRKDDSLLDTDFLNSLIVYDDRWNEIDFSRSIKNISVHFFHIKLNLIEHFDPNKQSNLFLQSELDLFKSKVL